MVRKIEIPYAPRALQLELHRAWSEHRFSVAITHRRFGKSVCAINHLLRLAMTSAKPNPRMHLLCPTFRQAKTTLWDYLKQFSAKIPGVRFNETELRADYENGARIQLLSGAQGGHSIRGIMSDFFVIDEAGLMHDTIFPEIVRPALADRNGLNGEKTGCIFVGTPMGHNALYDWYVRAKEDPTWHCAVFKASETGILPDAELREAKSMMPESIYEAEFECSFESHAPGAVYGKEMRAMEENDQIGRIPIDPSIPVQTFWDIGVNDATSIIFAQISHGNRSIDIVDYVEVTREQLPFFADLLAQKKKQYGWIYEAHYGPHDVINTDWSGKHGSRQQEALQLGINFRQGERRPLEEGINAVKMMLPRCHIDRERCKRLLESMRFYHRVYDPKNQIFRSTPVHDWSSHAESAMRVMATSIKPVAITYDEEYARPNSFAGSWMG